MLIVYNENFGISKIYHSIEPDYIGILQIYKYVYGSVRFRGVLFMILEESWP